MYSRSLPRVFVSSTTHQQTTPKRSSRSTKPTSSSLPSLSEARSARLIPTPTSSATNSRVSWFVAMASPWAKPNSVTAAKELTRHKRSPTLAPRRTSSSATSWNSMTSAWVSTSSMSRSAPASSSTARSTLLRVARRCSRVTARSPCASKIEIQRKTSAATEASTTKPSASQWHSKVTSSKASNST